MLPADLGLYPGALWTCVFVLTRASRFCGADPRAPLSFALGGDADFFLGRFQNTFETRWDTPSALLGAPGAIDRHDFPDAVSGTFLLLTFLGLLTRDVGLLFNAFCVPSFALAIVSALSAAPLAVGATLLFAFLPYHFHRGVSHPHDSRCFPVPRRVRVCLWWIGRKRSS